MTRTWFVDSDPSLLTYQRVQLIARPSILLLFQVRSILQYHLAIALQSALAGIKTCSIHTVSELDPQRRRVQNLRMLLITSLSEPPGGCAVIERLAVLLIRPPGGMSLTRGQGPFKIGLNLTRTRASCLLLSWFRLLLLFGDHIRGIRGHETSDLIRLSNFYSIIRVQREQQLGWLFSIKCASNILRQMAISSRQLSPPLKRTSQIEQTTPPFAVWVNHQSRKKQPNGDTQSRLHHAITQSRQGVLQRST